MIIRHRFFILPKFRLLMITKMKKIICFLYLFFNLYYSDAQEITTYYFIRHAEKVRTDSSDKNPSLNDAGFQRAKKWQEVFSNITFDAIYSTNYLRTKLTAKPTADYLGLPILLYDSKNMYSQDFQKATKGKTVLVVGHSNTTHVFVNRMLRKEKYLEIEDNNNSNLYIVSIINGKASSLVLRIN